MHSAIVGNLIRFWLVVVVSSVSDTRSPVSVANWRWKWGMDKLWKGELCFWQTYTFFLSFVLFIKSCQSSTVYVNYTFNKMFCKTIINILKKFNQFLRAMKLPIFLSYLKTWGILHWLCLAGSVLLKNMLLRLNIDSWIYEE